MCVFTCSSRVIRFIVSITLLLVACHIPGMAQYQGFALANPKAKRVAIPFELHSNLIVIPVVVNDGEELKFILDTGVRNAILTNSIYVEGLPSANDRLISLLGAGNAGQISAYVSSNISIDLPGVSADGNAMLILKEDYLMLESYLGTRIHGILGYEIFSRFVVEIDYINRVIILHKPEHFRPRRSYAAIPITIEDTKPYIKTQYKVNDTTHITLKLMVDTGASHSLLLNTSSCPDIQVPEKHLSGYLGRGLSGDIYGHLGRIEELKINKYKLDGVIASFPEHNELVAEFTGRVNSNGNIGGAILKRFKVIFDYANDMMYIKKNRLFRKNFEYNMSGMDLIAIGPLLETYVVSKVTKGSPAYKAGMLEGDVVLSVNNVAFPELTLASFSNLVNSRPGKKINIRIMRNGQVIKKKFELERVL
jgi:hypothetical protein